MKERIPYQLERSSAEPCSAIACELPPLGGSWSKPNEVYRLKAVSVREGQAKRRRIDRLCAGDSLEAI